mgnify:FL=1
MPFTVDSFDLLISLSAGLLAEPCTKYVAKDCHLLVNDSHGDASMTFVNCDWNLVAYWDNDVLSCENLERCFQVQQKDKSTVALTRAQAQEAVETGTVSMRSYKLKFQSAF